MYNRNDPRFRRTLNQISQNLESANESAQVGLFSFSENYVKPCFSSIAAALEPCTTACFPSQRDRVRRQHRTRARGLLEHSFDFYDDWEDDENDALLALEDEEFERVVGGYGTQSTPQQPQRRSGVANYAARRDARLSPRARRKSAVLPYDSGPDPTVIPNQSYFGFLSKLPFNIGRGGLRYKPSVADLQERSKGADKFGDEAEPLLEEDEYQDSDALQEPSRQHGRRRSGTTGSGHTTDSYSSRGDIFPSDDEDDAVPIDEEFSVALERRTTNSGPDDTSSSKTKNRRRADSAHLSSDPPSSKSSSKGRSKGQRRSRKSSSSTAKSQGSDPEMGELASLSVLKQEEQQARAEEEEGVEKKREAAQKLAVERGLSSPGPADAAERVEPRFEKEPNPAQENSAGIDEIPATSTVREIVEVADGPISMEDLEQSKPLDSSMSE